MKPAYLYNSIFICLLLVVSCTEKKPSEPSLYTIKTSDFEDKITVDGAIQPVLVTSVTCPANIDGTIVWMADEGSLVNEGDTICILEDKNMVTSYNNSLINLQDLQANQNKVKADLALQYALLDAEVKNNQAQTEIARLDSLQLEYSSPAMRKIREQEIQIELNKLNIRQQQASGLPQPDLNSSLS